MSLFKKKDSIESPDFLAMRTDSVSVKRLNNIPKYVGLVLIVLIGFVIVRGAVKTFSDPEERLREEEKPKKLDSFAVPAVSKPDGPDVMLPPSPPPEVFTAPPMPVNQAMPAQQPMPEYMRQRIESHKAAMQSSPKVTGFGQAATNTQGAVMPPRREPDQGRNIRQDDLNRQEEKREFLSSFDKDASPYLNQTRVPAISPYEVKAGFIIPGVLVSGINSDLPGQIIGQVRQNVYDSATGRYLLIPAGAKIVGTYDSSVSAGQERVLVAWNRIIFPDSSSVSLEAMPGADQSGFAGFHDQVDNHYWRTFGNAALLSLFSAGVQLSQPRGAVTGTYNSQQIMAAAIGRQLGQLGMQLTQRNLSIQPTLEVRPGFQFSIMVTKDMVLPPWKS